MAPVIFTRLIIPRRVPFTISIAVLVASSEMLDPAVDYFVEPVDIFVIGFEEIVDLNAGNIMSARWVPDIIIFNAIIWRDHFHKHTLSTQGGLG